MPGIVPYLEELMDPVDAHLRATFPNRSADVQGMVPAGGSITSLAKEVQTELRGRSSSNSHSLCVSM